MIRGRCQAMAIVLLALTLKAGECPAQCDAPATWFPHAATREPDQTHAPTSNCEFHQWAWQEFLWLTQPPDGKTPRFLTFPTEHDLFAPDTPMPFDSVSKDKMLVLSPRTTETSTPTDLDDVIQAGSRGMLIDQRGRSVYYISHVNKTYYDFVRTKKLYTLPGYLAAPADLNFPVGTLELKSSWMIVPEGVSTAGFFATRATIAKLTCPDGGAGCKGRAITLDKSNTEVVTVALVGLHVVGVVKDHPEFIWATFEHKQNAPDLPPGMDPSSSSPVDRRFWTFYQANTPANACNVPNNDPVTPTVTLVDPATQKLTPISNLFRQAAFGGGPPTNVANIKALNASVAAQLGGGDIWGNYQLTGGVWMLPNVLVPDLPKTTPDGPKEFAALQRGSLQLANPTMESFTQAKNCFDCHQTTTTIGGGRRLPAKNLNLSHILTNNLIQDSGVAALGFE